MRSINKEVIKKQISFSIPETVYKKVRLAAQSGGHSISAWLKFAICSYVQRWKFPSDDVNTSGLFCTHPACHRAAAQCKRPDLHMEQWIKNDL